MQVEMPFYEGPEDALRAVVSHLGGSKKVGQMLWPDKTVDASARHLLDCLNPSRAEKLDIGQVMFLFAKAKEAGCHAPFAWICHEVGYEARPIAIEEEEDRLVAVVESAGKTFAAAVEKLERLQRARTIRAA